MLKNKFLVIGLIGSLSACQLATKEITDRVCLLTNATEQVVQGGKTITSGQQTVVFNIQGQPTDFTEKRNGQDVHFSIEYQGQSAVHAYLTGKPDQQVTFFYNAENKMSKAIYYSKNIEQAIYTFVYDNGRINSLNEVRKADLQANQPANRTFQFVRDDKHNVIQQTLTTTVPGQLQTQEEWQFKMGSLLHRSPYADFSQSPIFLVLSMANNPGEVLPARFLQVNDFVSYERKLLRTNNPVLLESATCQAEYDAFNNPVRRTIEQVIHPNTQTQRATQTFAYNCSE
ncbi:hypothetical protein [Tellurirhabdus bombi]|uniref:hypothetical protein n=1 Tax=Tellurirhabdus bombi TaxID=2907205 RepID=UPI001F24397C|nr:hypothetical protein [Tellurirhabdus bombi]